MLELESVTTIHWMIQVSKTWRTVNIARTQKDMSLLWCRPPYQIINGLYISFIQVWWFSRYHQRSRWSKKRKFFHYVHEKDALLEANLRKVPKLKRKFLHPRNCKQNFPIALAIFHETITAAFQTYFPDGSSTVKLLKLFS